jgi:hypothetical protein
MSSISRESSVGDFGKNFLNSGAKPKQNTLLHIAMIAALIFAVGGSLALGYGIPNQFPAYSIELLVAGATSIFTGIVLGCLTVHKQQKNETF